MLSPSRRFAGLFAASLVLLTLPAPAALAQLVGPEFRVNSYVRGNQYRPRIAVDGSGNFIVVWDSWAHQDGDRCGVFGQMFDAAGLPVGTEFQVNTYTTGHQGYSAVAADAAGNFIVAWQSPFPGGNYERGIFARRYDSAGLPLGAEFRVDSRSGENAGPDLAVDGAGNAVVVWQRWDEEAWGLDVFGQRLDPDGVPLGGEFQVNGYVTGYQGLPTVAAAADGEFVVTWYSSDQDGSSSGVFARRYDSEGLPRGSEFQVNSYTTGSQGHSAVAVDGGGNFVVVWQSEGQDGSGEGVFGQRFSSSGRFLGPEFRISTHTEGPQHIANVARDGSGEFVVAWYGDSAAGYGLFAQQFDSRGRRRGAEFRITDHPTDYWWRATMAANGAGHLTVAWNSLGQDGFGWGVYGRRVGIVIFSDGFEAGDLCAWSASLSAGGLCPP